MIHVFDDLAALARAAATAVAETAAAAIDARGRFRAALPGGTTPRLLFEALAHEPVRSMIDWARVELSTTDERAVPSDDEASNYGLLARTLLGPLAIPSERVLRMKGDVDDLEAEAEACAPWFNAALDLVVLGIGSDGHTASIFPGHSAAHERTRSIVAVYDSPKPPSRRLTITPPVIARACAVMVLAAGDEKAAAVAAALEGAADPKVLPARLARGGTWYLDRGAASGLLDQHATSPHGPSAV